VTLQSAYTVDSILMVRLAALAGMGIAVMPAALVADDLAAGTLCRLLPGYEIDDPDSRVSIVYPGRRYLPAKTRRFIDHTVEHFEGVCGPPALACRTGRQDTAGHDGRLSSNFATV
jgi:DNA-binding transcriptional LysR family regulator